VLGGLSPVLDRLDPFLANLNPILRYLTFNKKNVTDFLGAPGFAHAGVLPDSPDDPAPRHALRIISNISTETLSIWPQRLRTNRGNTYLAPGALSRIATDGIFPNFDCKNTDYAPGPASAQDTDEQEILPGQKIPDVNGGNPPGTTPTQFAPCFVRHTFPGGFGDGRAPEVFQDP
jgi:phospholipid/cholesterol/gamma-HCH transport system substrate-binding protein